MEDSLSIERQFQWQSTEGVHLLSSELRVHAPCCLQSVSPASGLVVGLTLYGAAESVLLGASEQVHVIPPNYCWALPVQEGSILESRYQAGTRIAGAGFFLPADWLRFHGQQDPTLSTLLHILEEGRMRCADTPCQVEHHITQLLHNPYHGKLADLYLEARAHDLLFNLIETLSGTRRPSTPSHGERRLDKAHEIITTRLHNPPTLEELAREAGISISALRKDFKQRYGLPVMSYIRKRQLDEAREELRNGASVTATALKYGYDTPANFSTAFKRQHGNSPSQQRKRDQGIISML